MSSTITKVLKRDWDELVETIPVDLETSAQEHGALLRKRGIRSAADLPHLNLMYATLLSLRNTALWAACLVARPPLAGDVDRDCQVSTCDVVQVAARQGATCGADREPPAAGGAPFA